MSSTPQQFGDYHLLEKIATGGMAEVYRARAYGLAGFEKILVIKRIRPTLSSDPAFIRMFVNEAKIALPLTHGNVTSTLTSLLNWGPGDIQIANSIVVAIDADRRINVFNGNQTGSTDVIIDVFGYYI